MAKVKLLTNFANLLHDLIPKNTRSNTFSEINFSKTVFLFVGKLTAAKGVLEFIKGFIALQEKYPEKVHALIIGAGELSGELDQLVKINNIDKTNLVLLKDNILEIHPKDSSENETVKFLVSSICWKENAGVRGFFSQRVRDGSPRIL